MISEKKGKVIKGLGGLYEVRTADTGEIIVCRAKGTLKRDEDKVFVGDEVSVTIDDTTPDGVVISKIDERRSALIRPPISNLDYLFIVFAAAKPTPVIETVDKLISICEYNSISPVVVITKADVAAAEEYEGIYRLAGIPTFVTSSESGEGTEELSQFVRENITMGKTAAFAGASGVGKSTLLNSLFPKLTLNTAEISRKIERGRHTKRHVELCPLTEGLDTGFLADTPGFSLLDFARFDFFGLDELFSTFREFSGYVGKCRYGDCSHTGEGAEECALAKAAQEGKIAPSRLESYRSIYKILKEKKEYK